MTKEIIEIDGSTGEGGGQILRTACALSVLTKKPCRVFNIRKKRPNPGLQTQHLLGLRALAELCNGRLEGDFLGSQEIKFWPGEILAKDLTVKIETAGSITLLLQALIPPALSASSPVKIVFDGGATDTFFAPTIDHFILFLKILEKMGARVEIEIIKRGYFPVGGAKVIAKIFPSKLKPINLTERGEFKKILILSKASELLKKKRVAERQAIEAKKIFENLKIPIETQIEYVKSDCPGSSILTAAIFTKTILAFDNLGKLGKPAEKIAQECALNLLNEERKKACLDRFMSDQILIYLALANGVSTVSVSEKTSHFQTNCWVIPHFLRGNFEIKDNLVSWVPEDKNKI